MTLGSGLPQDGYHVEELWYLLVRQNWTTLAVVSPDSPQNAWACASDLATVGTAHGWNVSAARGIGIDKTTAAELARFLADPAQRPASGSHRVVAVDCPGDNPVAIRVLGVCDAVLLLLELGVTNLPRARRQIQLIGPKHVIGAVVVQPPRR